MNVFSLLLRASRGRLVLAVLLGLVSGASSTRLISLINEALTREGPINRGLMWGFAAVLLVAAGSRCGSQMLLNRLHYGALYELRMRLCRQILAAPLRRLESVGPHRLMSVLQEDAIVISQGLMQLPNLIINAALVVGCLLYLAWLSWLLFLGMLGVMVLGLGAHALINRYALGLLRGARERIDALFAHFRSLSDGIKELKLHRGRREAFFTEQLEPAAAGIRDLYTRGSDTGALSAAWAFLLHFSLIGLMVFVFPALREVDSRTLVGYALVVLYLQGPLDSIMNLFHTVLRAGVAVQNVERMGLTLAEEGTEAALAVSHTGPRTFRRLELVGVTHSYHRENEDSRFTLGPIDLHLEQGELVFLVGGNGSGKTTLAKLLTGLYAPESGELRLDGEPVTEAGREHYRQHFATVFSDFHLFERLLGLVSPELAPRTQALLARLQLDRKVRLQDGVLSTTALSQGQRKRLALLTSWLEDRPIYVFDEWAADQDPIFKDVFYRELLPELKRAGKTVVVISHDDRYFPLADRLIRLESGSVVPAVTPPEVVSRAS